jgi:hypothetical protein
MKKIILHAIVFFPVWIFAQTYIPHYKLPCTVNNDSSLTLADYQVLVTINTQALISAGHMRMDGGDIRFTPVGCNPSTSTYYEYWIESGLYTDSTRIWVKLPLLPPSSATQFLLWYGDNSALSLSNFNLTFPNAYISAGHDTSFSGQVYYDWFQLDAGDMINLQMGSPLEIRSRVIKMNGSINGNGMGYSAPIGLDNGNGPGGGGMSSTAGAGGGSYGGFGGAGGYDMGDIPGDGGSSYGLASDFSLLLGSSGGTTDNAIGGNGGGAIQLSAEWIEIDGHISVNGTNGVGSIGRCGGGGSGGTILLLGENINVSSNAFLEANGGYGGSGASAAHDGGGGGGGGRIKVFYKNNGTLNGSFLFNGGSGGSYGSIAPGTSGGQGTHFDTIKPFTSVTLSTLIGELALEATIHGLDSIYCLNKDSVHMFATPPGGIFAGPGVAADYFYPLTAGVGIHQITYAYSDPYGCGNLYDTVTVEVLNIPTFPFASNNSPLCAGNTILLLSSDSLADHSWTGPNGFSSSQQNPIIPSSVSTDGGVYSVTITNAAGCSSTIGTNVTVYPAPTIFVSNSSPICLDEDLSLVAVGGLSYNWTGPNGFASATQNPTLGHAQFFSEGIYTVTITDGNGCSMTATTIAEIDGCFDDIEDHPENAITVYPNPTLNEIWIDVNDFNFSGDITFELMDLRGRKILGNQLNLNSSNRAHIDLSAISNGTYILLVSDGYYNKTFKILKD